MKPFKGTENFTVERLRKESGRIARGLQRSRLGGHSATLTLQEWLSIIETYNGLCAYCKQMPYEVMDHVIPVSKRGGTTKENCVPACKACNASKGNRYDGLLPKRDLPSLSELEGLLFDTDLSLNLLSREQLVGHIQHMTQMGEQMADEAILWLIEKDVIGYRKIKRIA